MVIMNKKANLDSKVGKFFLAKQRGLSARQASLEAGYSRGMMNQATKITKFKSYRAIEEVYAKKLLTKISTDEIAEEHAKNIRQDENLAAKNTAIQMALDKIEPENTPPEEENVVIVFKPVKDITETQQ